MADLIDEAAYTKAIQPLEFSGAEDQPGGHAWARKLVEGYEASRRDNLRARCVDAITDALSGEV